MMKCKHGFEFRLCPICADDPNAEPLTVSSMAGSVGNGCWNCRHEQEQDDIYCDVCVACDWFSNWEKPNERVEANVDVLARLFPITSCYQCSDRDTDKCICNKTGKMHPPPGSIPDWCPLKPSELAIESSTLLAEIEEAIPLMGNGLWYALPFKTHDLIDEHYIKTGRMESKKRPDGGRLFRLANVTGEPQEREQHEKL